MPSKAGQIGLLSRDDHTIRLLDSSRYGLFVKRSQCTQIDNLDSTSRTLDDICSSRTGFKDHRTPGDNYDIDRTLADTETTRFADRERIIAIGHVPIFCHCGNDITFAILWGLRTIEATTF